MTTHKELMRRDRLSSFYTNAVPSLELRESVPILDPCGKKIVMERVALDKLVEYTVDSGPSELEYTLLNVIAMFDETMKLFCTHATNCAKMQDETKMCDCGADAARETYLEIQMLLAGAKEQ